MLKPIQMEALKLMFELVNNHPDVFTIEDHFNWSQNLTQFGDESICEEAYRVFTEHAERINSTLMAKAHNMINAYYD